MNHPNVLLRITNISKTYHSRKVLTDVSFEVMEGEVLGLLGLSGCGKSTLLKIICGFLKPNTGKISYHNLPKKYSHSMKEMNYIKSLIGFSAQEPSFYPELTVLENLLYFGTLLGIEKTRLYSQIDKILETFDLSEFKPMLSADLSEGMKKRLDIACSIIHDPKILILDEPTANLDYRLRDELLIYIHKLNKKGMTILFVSHYIDEVQNISNRIAILNKGVVKVVHAKDLRNSFAKIVDKK
jgi:ABC-2 type transport system ATP-binding protein